MPRDGERSLPKGRLGRLTALGTLAGGLATELGAAAGKIATGAARDEATAKFHRAAAEKMLASLGRMKGLPMKVGQLLSYIDDFIPPEHRETYRQILQQLQIKARPMRLSEIEAVVRADLGRPPKEIFRRFGEEPIAAASIGQVYRAELQDGTPVAVKVQYPGIADAIRSDIDNIDLLRTALSVILPKVDLDATLSDLTARVLEECDYGCELNNQEELRAAWAGDPDVLVPRTFEEVSGDRVLVTEYVDGKRWAEMIASASNQDKQRIGRILFRFVFRSLYAFSMFNADPHPGNYLFLDDGRVAFLDFGCVQRYPRETLEAFRTVRRKTKEGLEGRQYRRLLSEAYGLPEDFDEEEWAFMEDFVRACFEPVNGRQPFRYSREYTQRLADLALRGATVGARKVLKKGIWEAKRPGLVFINRITFGLNSLLAELGAEADWAEVVVPIDEEADRRWALDRSDRSAIDRA